MEISDLQDREAPGDALETAAEADARASCVSDQRPSKRIVAGMTKANPSIQNHGFRKAMRAAFPDSEVADCANFIPDAFHISAERQVVTLIEVDDTNPIDGAKAEKIADFTLAVEDCMWSVEVLVLDYAGEVRAAIPGWAFMGVYTERFAPEGARDLTPAANAAARMIGRLAGPVADPDELADRL